MHGTRNKLLCNFMIISRVSYYKQKIGWGLSELDILTVKMIHHIILRVCYNMFNCTVMDTSITPFTSSMYHYKQRPDHSIQPSSLLFHSRFCRPLPFRSLYFQLFPPTVNPLLSGYIRFPQ